MQKTGDQDEIVAFSKIHFESISRNRVVARVNLRRPRIFFRHFQHSRPIDREYFRMRIVPRDRHAVHAVPRCDIEHLPLLPRIRVDKLGDSFSHRSLHRRH